MLADPGDFSFVARITTSGPDGAALQTEVPFHLVVEPVPPGQRAYISGRVVDAETGLPIPDVPVQARRADGTGLPSRIAHTDAHGRYLIQVLYGGDFIVQAGPDRAGYGQQFYPGAATPEEAQPVHVPFGRTVKGIDFALPPMGGITGRVIAAETGEPVPQPLVVVGRTSDTLPVAKATGFEDGSYVVSPLPPGEYWVYVAGTETLQGAYYRNASSLAEAQPVLVEARRRTTGIDFALALRPTGGEYGILTGRVTDEENGTPLGGMVVYAMRTPGPEFGTAETAPDGTYAIQVPPGWYIVSAADPRRRGITECYDHVLEYSQATPVQVRRGETTGGHRFHPTGLAPGAGGSHRRTGVHGRAAGIVGSPAAARGDGVRARPGCGR